MLCALDIDDDGKRITIKIRAEHNEVDGKFFLFLLFFSGLKRENPLEMCHVLPSTLEPL